MPKSETRVAVSKFLRSQKLLDMNMTLNDLAERIGDDIDPLAGYVAHPVPWTQVCLTRRA